MADSNRDKVNPFMEMMYQARPLEGGWSRSSKSGNRQGYQTSVSGISQGDKESEIAAFTDRSEERPEQLSQTEWDADWAVKKSMDARNKLEPSPTDSEQDFRAKQSGLLNEAFETARLSDAGIPITASQYEVFSGVNNNRRVPDLKINDGGRPRFVDIKTASLHDPQQITDIFNSREDSTGVDVVFSNSSRNIEQASLDHLKLLEKSGSQVDPTRSIRVRSNSMAEGTFITPNDMQKRIDRRANTHKTAGS